MNASFGKGQVGACLFLNAVYEGSPELQKISENSIFGDATPNGSVTLQCDTVLIEPFEHGEEYYVEFHDPDVNIAYGLNAIMVMPVEKHFRSEDNPNFPSSIQYRLTPIVPGVGGSISMTICNPPAIAFLDEVSHPIMVIRKAVGRRSDAEIAIRERMLEEAKAALKKRQDDYEAEAKRYIQYAEIAVQNAEKALARARGEV